ncbi:hypothetical protein OC842_002501 [Tilletia horrida]|uniref:Uncharacterized protein n=1 Tax=Tilletia horrida TaxID=155126 RepID=A0AAN6GF77_9BASI|nr:hypothetical protein OC842_002501 [Tilletia horrida]
MARNPAAASRAAGGGGGGGPEADARHRPLSLALPGSSLDFGSFMQQAEVDTTTTATASRQRMPTSASSSNFLLPPLPSSRAPPSPDAGQVARSSSSSSSPLLFASTAPGSPASTSTATSSSLLPRPHNTASAPTPAAHHQRQQHQRLQGTSASPHPTISTTIDSTTNTALVTSPIAATGTAPSATSDYLSPQQSQSQPPSTSSNLCTMTTGITHPAGNTAATRHSTDSSSRRSPSASPIALPMLLISDALRGGGASRAISSPPGDASSSGTPSGADQLQLQQHLSHRRMLAQAHHKKAFSAADLPFRSIRPEIHLQVLPLAETITMFGSTQTTSNYSISGKCVLSISPKSGATLGELELGTEATSASSHTKEGLPSPRGSSSSPTTLSVALQKSRPRSPSPLVVSSTTEDDGNIEDQAAQAAADERASSAITGPTLRVTSLKASFRGYALYMDHTARFSALRLADVEQECLPDGAVLPFPLPNPDVSASSSSAAVKETSRYEIDFDLSVPGWLPASLRSRFGGNFYCVAAVATLADGRIVRSPEASDAALRDAFFQNASTGEVASLATLATPTQSASVLDGLPTDRTPAYADAVAGSSQSIDGMPSSARGAGAGQAVSTPASPGVGSGSGSRRHDRAESPLPPLPLTGDTVSEPLLLPPSAVNTARPLHQGHPLPHARPASYAPGSHTGIDYERTLPAVVDDAAMGRRGMPASASLGVLDSLSGVGPTATGGGGGRRSTSSLAPPGPGSRDTTGRSMAAAPSASGSSTPSSALSRFKSFRQGRHSAAAAVAADEQQQRSSVPHSPSLGSRADMAMASALRPGEFGNDALDGSEPSGASPSLPREDALLSPSLAAPGKQKKGSNNSSASAKDGTPAKARTSWLSKRAKQLSIHSSSSSSKQNASTSTGADADASVSQSSSSQQHVPPLSASGSTSGLPSAAVATAPPGQSAFRERDDLFGRGRSSERGERPSSSDLLSSRHTSTGPAGRSGAVALSTEAQQQQRNSQSSNANGRPSLHVQTGDRGSAISSKAAGKGKSTDTSTDPCVEELADGSLLVKSQPKVIVIRRCRDVVPVPVARVAQPGVDGLNIPQADGTPGGTASTAAPGAAPPAEGMSGAAAAATAAPQREVPARLASNEVIATSANGQPTRAAILDEAEGARLISVTGVSAGPGVGDALREEMGDTDEADLHPLERRERERAEMMEDEGMHDGEEAGEISGVLAPASTATATTARVPGHSLNVSTGVPAAGAAVGERNGPPARAPPPPPISNPAPAPNNADPPGMLPPAPSALNAPTDPHKLAAMASAARNAASTGPRSSSRRAGPSRSGGGGANGNGPGGSGSGSGSGAHTTTTTTSSGGSGAPMRHFLHRPVLHAPAESNIEGDGLPFALTLSLPSHVHVEGANSDMLTFGLQIEVGRSPGWSRVRELGGLRLRDMELVCLQTERHSSAASRTFCNAFALPADPRLTPQDIPVLPDPSATARKPYPASEHRLRQGYDREVLVNHIRMVQSGNVPNQRENNVERSRTTIVGPPPLPSRSGGSGASGSGGAGTGGTSEGDAKDRKGKKANRGDGQPKSKKEARKSVILPNLPDPRELGGSRGNGEGSSSSAAAAVSGSAAPGGSASGSGTRGGGGNDSSSSVPPSPSPSKPLSRSRRAYANAMNRLSHFASAMLDGGNDSDHAGAGESGSHGASGSGSGGAGDRSASGTSQQRRDKDGASSSADQPRATYSFNGEDGNGVDLTKGRVRMTINLPLVPSNAEKARQMGAVQLIPDYESPYVRIRHKLKVKLGFGFGGSPLGGEGWWGQALVMCVPVRFTDSPPAEARQPPPAATIQSRAGSSDNSSPSAPSASIDPIIETIAPTVPVLPAYTQLFREDGSRLGDEGEDLPQYPGMPEGFGNAATGAAAAATGERSSNPEGDANGRARRPSLLRHHRGSITGPQPPHLGSTANGNPNGAAEVDNRIIPSRVVDEAAPNGGTDAQTQAAAARELAEMSDVGEAEDEDDDEVEDEADDEEEEEEEGDGMESEMEQDGVGHAGASTTSAIDTSDAASAAASQSSPAIHDEHEDERLVESATISADDVNSHAESFKGKSVASAHAGFLAAPGSAAAAAAAQMTGGTRSFDAEDADAGDQSVPEQRIHEKETPHMERTATITPER